MNGLRIAVDIDGVLGNQITHILTVIKDRYDIIMRYSDITQWDLPIKDTDIKELIEHEQLVNEEYILGMPVHKNAKKILDKLFLSHRIAVVTARAEETDNRSKLWLEINKIPFDEFINIRGKNKSDYKFDVIIDDYPKHIETVVDDHRRYGLLFRQPWNEKDKSLSKYEGKNLFVVTSWDEIYEKIKACSVANT